MEGNWGDIKTGEGMRPIERKKVNAGEGKRSRKYLGYQYRRWKQGWEFAHRFSECISRFLPKNEQMSDSLKKISDSLIRSFLVSDLSDSLISFERPKRIAHGHSFLVSDLSDLLKLLIFGERPERFTHIAHQIKEMSDSLIFSIKNIVYKTYKKIRF